ncbi:MAG: hypothetical protein A2Y10_05965 [Planctomycetes bacterium GWF2_41_51]|nr:MAG: hypothetical protein A2Y10_05965 [Planctomycetes bacterium GWF2_41_51]
MDKFSNIEEYREPTKEEHEKIVHFLCKEHFPESMKKQTRFFHEDEQKYIELEQYERKILPNYLKAVLESFSVEFRIICKNIGHKESTTNVSRLTKAINYYLKELCKEKGVRPPIQLFFYHKNYSGRVVSNFRCHLACAEVGTQDNNRRYSYKICLFEKAQNVLDSGKKQTETKDKVIKHRSENILCLHSSDRIGLRKAILKDPLADAVSLEGIHHPAHNEIYNPNQRLRIVGNPGCGKSFFLYQHLATFKDADIVILTSLVLTEVAEDLRQLRQSACRPLVIIIDNLHYHVGKLQYFPEVLSILLGQCKHNEQPVTVLVTHWSSERLKIEQSISQYHWDCWEFKEINLDNPPQEFISKIVKSVCEHLLIETDEEMQNAFVREIIRWENTPACAVASLWSYRKKSLKGNEFYSVELKVRERSWQYLFKELQKENASECITLIRSLSVSRRCASKYDLATIREIAIKVGKESDSAVDYAIERLEAMGWVKRDGATLYSHDLQIFPSTIGLHNDSKPSLFLERFSEMIIKNELLSLETDRITVLHNLSEMFEDIGQIQKSIEFNNIILNCDSENVRALCNRGALLVKHGNIEEGLSDLHRATEISPADVRTARIRYFTCHHLGRREDAVETLQILMQNLHPDSPDLAFVAQAFANLRETKPALKCVKQFVHTRQDDPDAYAVFAQVLWLAGKKKQAETIIDQALKRWPNEGRLLFVKADFKRRTHIAENIQTALLLAEKALQIKPNDPNIYTLVAILNLEAGNINRGSEVAETGTELFKFWPDLLAARGFALEQQGRFKEALSFLLQANEENETLSETYRPYFLLCLGRVYLRLGDKVNAENYFEQAVSEGVDKTVATIAKAKTLRLTDKTEDAIHVLEEAVKNVSDSPDLWTTLGNYYFLSGRYYHSTEAFRAAGKLKPKDPQIISFLGECLIIVGRPKEALKVWKQVIKINPEDEYAWGRLGSCFYELSKYTAAARTFETAIANGDNSFETSRDYVFTLVPLKRLEDALAYCDKMLLQNQNNALAYLLKAHCYLEQGKHEDAKSAASEALRLGDDNENICRELCDIFGRMGLIEKVICLWRKSQQLGWHRVVMTAQEINRCLEFLFKQSDDVLLMEFLEYIHKTYKPDEFIMTNMARCATRLGRQERAVEIYGNILCLNPLSLSAVEERAEILLTLKRSEELFSPVSTMYKDLHPWLAAIYLAQAFAVVKEKEKTIEAFLTAVKELPDPSPVNTPCFAMQQFKEVAEHFDIRKELEKKFESSEYTPMSGAEAHLAAILTSKREFELKYLRTGHELAPNRILLSVDLAMGEFFAGNKDKAIELAHCIAESESPTAIALATAANVLIKSGASAEDGLSLAERAIELVKDPDSELWYAQLQKAESLNCLGRFEEALKVGKVVLSSVMNPSTVLAVLRSLKSLKRWKEAVKLAEFAMKKFPDNIEIKTILVFLLNVEGRDKECMELVKNMGVRGEIMISPLLLDMGDCLVRAKEYEQAIECYRTAREKSEKVKDIELSNDLILRAIKGEIKTVFKQGKKQQALDILNAFDSSLWLLKVEILADIGHFEEGMNLLVQNMELQAEAGQPVDIKPMGIAIKWLPKCKSVPLVGLHIGALWLGLMCLHTGCSTQTKKFLKVLSVLDWNLAQRAAKTGNRESKLALSIIQKAKNLLEQQKYNSPKQLSLKKTQHTPTILESLMRHVLYTEWSHSSKKEANLT